MPLLRARRVVVKVGSALLVDAAEGSAEPHLAGGAGSRHRGDARPGQEVLLVSSGAIALGRRQLGLNSTRLKLEEKQAAAAIGQIRLAHAWTEVLELHLLTVAQILLTSGDTEERRRYLNARNTLATLLSLGSIPVINENDTVATAEIRYGDNDRLAARVAQMISADCLVLFSDVDGMYTADPTRDPTARFIPDVHSITADIERMAGGASSASAPAAWRRRSPRRRLQLRRVATWPSRSAANSIRCDGSRRARAALGFIPPSRRRPYASNGLRER